VAATHTAWASRAVASYFELPAASAAFATAATTPTVGALLGSVLGLLAAGAVALEGVPAALAMGCVWVLWESLCMAVLPFYPWASLAVTQAGRPEVLQIASWLGHSAVSFCVAATGAALGLAASTRSPRDRRRLSIAALSIVSIVLVIGGSRLWRRASVVDPPSCSVQTIDAAIGSGTLPREEVLRSYETATAKFLVSRPDAVVWPESALPAPPEVDAPLRARLRERAGEWGVVVLAGGPGVAWGGGWEAKTFNSVFRIGADEPIQRYDKRRLVPFAEYWPAIGIGRPHWLDADETVPGKAAALFRVGACRLGVLVCFEGDDDALARELARAGADAILVVSNDAHLPRLVSRLEVAQLQLRAVETGVGVVRAANRGPSAVIDRYGRLLELSSASSVVARIPKSTSAAPSLDLAAPFRLLCHAAALLAVGWSTVRQRRPL
jgi:apolipoprotein N-acyltransferase